MQSGRTSGEFNGAQLDTVLQVRECQRGISQCSRHPYLIANLRAAAEKRLLCRHFTQYRHTQIERAARGITADQFYTMQLC